METSIQEIVNSIDTLTTIDSGEDLNRLQELVDLYFAHPQSGDYLDVWFRLYERFPNGDGSGIFWSILHGIETYHPHADRLVVESVLRKPSEFPLMMINRIVNAGIKRVGEVDLLQLIDQGSNPK